MLFCFRASLFFLLLCFLAFLLCSFSFFASLLFCFLFCFVFFSVFFCFYASPSVFLLLCFPVFLLSALLFLCFLFLFASLLLCFSIFLSVFLFLCFLFVCFVLFFAFLLSLLLALWDSDFIIITIQALQVLVELVSRVKLEPDVPVELAPKKSSGAAKDKARW